MVNVSVARRYARALLDVASEANALDKVADQLSALADAVGSNAELRDVLQNPAYPRQARRSVLEAVIQAVGANEAAIKNLVQLLIDRDRAAFLPDIARIFRSLADAKQGRLRGSVTSAVPLPRESVDRLAQALERITQRNIVLETKVDPSLIGGVSAQVGSIVYDGSIRTQLVEMRRALKQA